MVASDFEPIHKSQNRANQFSVRYADELCVWVCINFLTVSFIPIAIGWVCASENLVVGWNSATDSIKVFVVGLAKLVRFALLFRSVIPLGEVAYKRLKITKLYLFRCLHRIFLQNKSG